MIKKIAKEKSDEIMEMLETFIYDECSSVIIQSLFQGARYMQKQIEDEIKTQNIGIEIKSP